MCVTRTVAVGGGPFGAAVDSRTDTVYVTNSADGTVSVINGHTGTVVATVKVGKSPGGIAVNPQTGIVYVADDGSNTVSVLGPCK